MIDLFYEGGPLFMSLITIVFLFMLVVAFVYGGAALKNGKGPLDVNVRKIRFVKSFGLLALVIGVLAQLLGLYSAFEAMSKMDGDISTPILAGGLKVSMISALYGLIVYLISYVIWLFLSWKINLTKSV